MLKHNNLFFKLFFWLLIITVLSFSLFACDYLEIAEPTIQYYEFPIRIEYKIKNLTEDEVIVIEDTLICEYKGILKKPIYLWFDYGPPHERVWDGHVNYTHSDDVNYILYSNYSLNNGLTNSYI